MKPLASLHGWIVSQVQAWPHCQEVQTLKTEAFAEDQFHFKVRAQLTEAFFLQIRFYYNSGHLNYAYQLFTDGPILRWDNKEDGATVLTAPHHFHNEQDQIAESPLNGDPAHDCAIVREAVSRFLNTKE